METQPFEAIYQSYFDPVYRYALSLSGDAHAAEEITQETFFKALRSLNQFRGDSSIKSWLCAIAKNIWISEQRKKKAQPIEEVSVLPDPGDGPEETILLQEDSMRIHRLLHRLEEPYREVFTLRTLGQLSFRDIGDLFGKTGNWACVTYHRARAKLKKEMEAQT